MTDRSWIIIPVIVAILLGAIIYMDLAPGPAIHGTVGTANCNGGAFAGSNVIINLGDGMQRLFDVHYDTCTIFAQHLGGGVTINTFAYDRHSMSDYTFDQGPGIL